MRDAEYTQLAHYFSVKIIFDTLAISLLKVNES